MHVNRIKFIANQSEFSIVLEESRVISINYIHNKNSSDFISHFFHFVNFYMFTMNLEMRRDLVRCYYANGNSPTAALRAYKKEKLLINNPSNTTSIQRLIYKFETTFTLLNQPGRRRKSLADDRHYQLQLLSNQHHYPCQHLLYDGFLIRQIFIFLQ